MCDSLTKVSFYLLGDMKHFAGREGCLDEDDAIEELVLGLKAPRLSLYER